ncbi:MAG: T9SS type A sorting domain-containing protein, partial [Cytophagia bacterium]|nr:T9SS type A sorting domain-containing protein [Cytophagia bacterium]
KIYGEANPTFTITYTGFVNGDDATAITTEPTASTTADATTGVGTYDIDLAGGAADNYSFNLTSGTLTVNKATLTVTADDKSRIYGKANPTFTSTYSGFVNGDDKTVITAEPTASTLADVTTGVGTYDIDLAGGVADNYSFNLTSGTLTIGKATLTATADDKNKVYGEVNPSLTVTYSGFVNGDDVTAITTEPTASTTADATTGVGTYDISLSGGVSANYSFTTNKGTLTISKAVLTATADDKSKIYGESNPTFTITYTGFVNGDDATSITTEPTASTTADETTGVGTYDIDLTGGAADNYSFNLTSGTLTVNKATLTVTADDKQRSVGQDNPVFTITYSGFVNGDTEDDIDTEPNASTIADASTAAGTAAITLSGGSDNNYDFNLIDGTLTIVDAAFVTSVSVPNDGTYKIGDEMTFTVIFNRAITTTGNAQLDLTIGTASKKATQIGAVTDGLNMVFGYTIEEGDLDADGIFLGTSINLNGGKIVDEFATDALLTLNNVASTASVKVDGIRATPTLSTSAGDLTNTAFTVTVTYDEEVSGLSATDLEVSNGTVNSVNVVTAGLVWEAEIAPTADGTTTVSVLAGAVADNAGNTSVASTNTISTTFDGTAPEVSSIAKAEPDQIPTGTATRSFTVVFSEEVTGVDVTDFEVITTGTATASINAVTATDAKTYTVSVNGISGEGTIGLNAKDDGSIIDAATNSLADAFTGEVYTTNFAPTDITLSASSIQENNDVDEEVATLSTTDADAGDSFTYSLVSGTGDADNASFTINGDKLLAAEAFDFETKDSYSIRLKTDDGFGGSFEKELTINITNEGEAIIGIAGEGEFEQTTLGLSTTKTWTVTNSGDVATEVRIISSSQGFSFSPGSVQVEAGASQEITAVFSPSEAKVYSGVVVFNYDITDDMQDNVIEVNLSGEGVIVTGIDNGQISDEQIAVFPNPASSYITIDLSDLNGMPLDIRMVNPTGVSKLEKEGYDKPELRIDVTNFENGLYIIQFSNERSLVRKKVLIRK